MNLTRNPSRCFARRCAFAVRHRLADLDRPSLHGSPYSKKLDGCRRAGSISGSRNSTETPYRSWIPLTPFPKAPWSLGIRSGTARPRARRTRMSSDRILERSIGPRLACARSSPAILMVAASGFFVLHGCGTYQPKPVSVSDLSSSIDSRAETPLPVPPETIPLEQTGGRPFDLRDGWNLYELQVVALYNNPDLKAERDNIGVAEGLLVSAGKIPNPVITDSTFLAPLGSGAASLAMNIAEPILTAGKRRIAREGASVEINRVRAAIESREWDVTREIKARYWRLQYLDERLRLEQENIGLSERSLSIAQARLDAGDATPLDVELAASDLGTRRSRQQTLLSEKAVGTQELARLLGLPPSISFTWEKRENLYGEAA
ncbi:MAG: TolC family protein, partial [Planctomycetes bacterium]|nr:TolC family protein [Planctomycetota bacterium]